MASCDKAKGHEFFRAGVYSSPNLLTAYGYCIPACLLPNRGVLHACLVEMKSTPFHKRRKGGMQFITSDDSPILLQAVVIQVGHQLNKDWSTRNFVPIYNPWLEAGSPMRDPAAPATSIRASSSAFEADALGSPSGAGLLPQPRQLAHSGQMQASEAEFSNPHAKQDEDTPRTKKRPWILHHEDARFKPTVETDVPSICCDRCWNWYCQSDGCFEVEPPTIAESTSSTLAYLEGEYQAGRWDSMWSCANCWAKYWKISTKDARDRLKIQE